MRNIISLLRKDPQRCFESLIRPHLGDMYRVAYRFTDNRNDAEDLVQDVLAKLYQRAGDVAAVEKLRPWLTRVLYRQFLDNRRKNERTPFAKLHNPSESEHGEPNPVYELPGNAPDPEVGTEHHLLQQRLNRALDRLSEDHRTVMMFHDVEGYTLKELETILEAPLGTLKSRLHRARRQLRLEMETGMEPFSGSRRVNKRGQCK